MSDEGFSLYFNLGNETHYLRVRANLDRTTRGTQVYEGLIDGRNYSYFEVAPNEDGTIDVWEIFESAIKSYREQKKDDTVTKTRWRD